MIVQICPSPPSIPAASLLNKPYPNSVPASTFGGACYPVIATLLVAVAKAGISTPVGCPGRRTTRTVGNPLWYASTTDEAHTVLDVPLACTSLLVAVTYFRAAASRFPRCIIPPCENGVWPLYMTRKWARRIIAEVSQSCIIAVALEE